MQWGYLPPDSVRKKRSLLRQIDYDISRHGRFSVFGHLIVFVFVEWLMGFNALSPVQSYSVGLVLFLVAVWRLHFLIRFNTLYGRGPQRWRHWYGMATLAGAGAWSVFLVMTIVLPGYDASLTFIWIYTTAVAATHIYIFAPYPQMADWYNRLMLIPPGIAGLLMFEPEYSSLGLGVLLFYVFMRRVGLRVTNQYWATVENNERLELELGRVSASEHRMALRAGDNDRFMANLTALIRTPLNGVLGMLSILSGSQLPREESKLVAVASRSANDLADLVDDFDTYVRVKGHMIGDETKVFKIAHHLETVLEGLGPVAHEHGLELSYIVKPGMPERVNGSPRQIATLFKQLITFAVNVASGDEVSIKVQASQEEDGIAVSVRFTGDMSDAMMDDLQSILRTESGFEALEQIDLARLSLVVSAQLVRQSEGRLRMNVLRTDSPRQYQLNIHLPLPPSTQTAAPFTASRHFAGKKALMLGFPEYGERAVRGELEGWGMSVAVDALAADDSDSHLSGLSENDFCLVNVPVRFREEHREALALLQKQLAGMASAPRVLLLASARHRSELSELFPAEQILNKPIPRRTLHRWLLKKPVDQENEADIEDLAAQLSGLRVLVAEDTPVNATVARKLLQRFGVTVELARTGAEALEKYRDQSFDMVWIDQELSDMSGHEAVALLRNDERAEGGEPVTILGITSSREPVVERNCLSAGMDDILVKPLDLSQVAETLQRHVG